MAWYKNVLRCTPVVCLMVLALGCTSTGVSFGPLHDSYRGKRIAVLDIARPHEGAQLDGDSRRRTYVRHQCVLARSSRGVFSRL